MVGKPLLGEKYVVHPGMMIWGVKGGPPHLFLAKMQKFRLAGKPLLEKSMWKEKEKERKRKKEYCQV